MLGLELVNKLGLGLVHKFSLTFILWNINLIISFKFEQPSDTYSCLVFTKEGHIKRRFLSCRNHLYSVQIICYSSNPKVLSRYKTCLVVLVVVLFQKLLWRTSWRWRVMFTLRRSVQRCKAGPMARQMYSSSLKKGTQFTPGGKILSWS